MTPATFSLLGPLDVRCHGQAVAVPAARQRSLLAALLLRANQPVPKQWLCEAVWGVRTSDRAEVTLRSYVMRLRRALGPSLAVRLSIQPFGYVFRLERDDELDLLRLEACLRQGKAAASCGDRDRAMQEFRAGLALWRGEPLCDVPSDYLHLSAMPRLAELRTQLWEGLCAAATQTGCAAEFIIPLQRLTEEDPLSERYAALFMSMLASCDRRVDALAEFRRLRRILVREQGVEPSARLQDLHRQLLRGDHVPAVVAAPETGPRRQLPRKVAALTGRTREIEELIRYLAVSPQAREALLDVTHALRLLGRWHSEVITAEAAAAVMKRPITDVSMILAALADASLLTSLAPGIYEIPESIRVFACRA